VAKYGNTLAAHRNKYWENMKIRSAVITFLFIVLTAGYAFAQDDGAVAWWKFDKGAGSIANDSIGNLPGMITRAKWTKGKFGGALKFASIEDYVNIPDDPALNTKKEITIELWMLIQKYNGYENNIILKPESYGIDLADGKIRFKVCVKRDYRIVCSQNITDTGTWHHIAGTYSASDGLLTLYLDGIISNTMTCQIPGPDINISEYDLFIGSTTEIPPICGLIDEVKIYNRRLTAEEIMKHAEWR